MNSNYEYNKKEGHNLKHGFCKKNNVSKFYKCWQKIKERCSSKYCKEYKYYGKIGIIYDVRWNKFENFYNDMWYKYTKCILCNHIENPSIERENVNGDYNRENCTFISRNKQQENRRNVRWFRAISPEGKIYITRNQSKFAKNHNLSKQGVNNCLCGKVKTHKKWRFINI